MTRNEFDAHAGLMQRAKTFPQWVVAFGTSTRTYYTEYHAEQMARALRLNGTPYTLKTI